MHYSRTKLPDQIADALQGKSLFGDAPNGLFLAAPRPTGKSTFLQADLMPQHALSSEAGEAAMMALKSARDQINRAGKVHLMLVLSGSDRDKLLRLVNTGAAPFFGLSGSGRNWPRSVGLCYSRRSSRSRRSALARSFSWMPSVYGASGERGAGEGARA